jgi:hypothetical protein
VAGESLGPALVGARNAAGDVTTDVSAMPRSLSAKQLNTPQPLKRVLETPYLTLISDFYVILQHRPTPE